MTVTVEYVDHLGDDRMVMNALDCRFGGPEKDGPLSPEEIEKMSVAWGLMETPTAFSVPHLTFLIKGHSDHLREIHPNIRRGQTQVMMTFSLHRCLLECDRLLNPYAEPSVPVHDFRHAICLNVKSLFPQVWEAIGDYFEQE